jgi:translin
MLDRLRDGDLETAEECLVAMDQIVDLLAELDYPDGMTAGLRRTTDVSRSLVERSRADLTTTVIQERLRVELSERTGEEP